MSASVMLFTDRPSFESAWRSHLARHGIEVSAQRPEVLPEHLEKGGAVLVDAGASTYDEDELLAHIGLARALGALPAVVLPPGDAMASVDELVDDLCAGLVARRDEDVPRMVAVLARRAGAARARRFEYVTVSPRGGELLAILADGSAVLLPRPAHEEDDGSEVAAIALSEDALRATLELANGRVFELVAEEVSARLLAEGNGHTQSSNGDIAAALGEIDGHKLGARIRSLRLAAGLTQAELARRTGIHRPNIARVEAGRHTPSLETLARLAAAIGVPTTRVLMGE